MLVSAKHHVSSNIPTFISDFVCVCVCISLLLVNLAKSLSIVYLFEESMFGFIDTIILLLFISFISTVIIYLLLPALALACPSFSSSLR